MRASLVLIALGLTCGTCNVKKEPGNSSNKNKPDKPDVVTREMAPFLFTDAKGSVYLSWTEQKDSLNHLKFATLQDNDEWSEPNIIAKGTNWFVNWADYPVLATKEGENIISHYLAKSSESTYSYDIMVKHSANGGVSWSKPHVLHDDRKAAEHGFVTILPYGDNFFVTWLDGRNTVTEENVGHSGHGSGGSMTLRAAVLSPAGKKLNEWELDKKVCDCCQTTAAITTNGPVVAYRDRSDEEIRDMSLVRMVDGNWTEPAAIHEDNWKIEGCPVNGPRMSALGNDLAIGWFSAAEGKAEVKIKFSHNGGADFGKAFIVSSEKPIGRVDLEMLTNKTAIISWMEGPDILAAKVSHQGDVLKKFVIATSSESRSSGFPQMTTAGDKLIFAWADTETKTIKTTILNP